ncbi:transporter [Aliivibrio fischeri MJ11]|uniref:Transporter n=1 Tax=Aliivibrio fischeri (strain MJ11) TaxID=388396 RepID=B5ESJ8_ALIFM|nr:YdcF family protein [Aliivibrio fischeri]ACH63373.1 transporter [Aliivibrio fischeri MJ11]
MKRTLLTLSLAVIFSGSLYSTNVDAALDTVQPQVDYTEMTSQRQVVDQLLNDAYQVFKNPSRISHAGFTAKMPSNMEMITNRLLEAYQLEPYRVDLLFSAANAQIYNSNVDRAIELFTQILSVASDDVDAHSYLVIWQNFKGNKSEVTRHLTALEQLNKGRVADLKKIMSTIDRIVETPLSNTIKKQGKGKNAIITLGYALNPDGSMNPILIDRLNATLDMAKKNPNSYIVVTGGVPKNHKTEGKLMADWLVKNGIDASRIIEDNYARSTVENALYSSYALARHNIDHATIISSASHVRRGQALFEVASWQTGPKGITFDTYSANDRPLEELKVPTDKELLGIYRDALRVYGMWSYRSYPLEQR